MAKIKIFSKGVLAVIRVSVKRDLGGANLLLGELDAAVHIGAAINAQIDRGNISELDFSAGQEILLISEDALPITVNDLIGEELNKLKRARRKLADKLGRGL